MSDLIDISPLISPRIAVWPGDKGFGRKVLMSIAKGDNIDLSRLKTTVHLGSHADAPSHYRGGAATMHEVPLETYYGPCQVISVAVAPGARILPKDLSAEITASRVLLLTGSSPDPEKFNEDFASLSPELVEFLAARGVVLIGIDTPSVDPFTSKGLEAHQALADHGVLNLEGLVLSGVTPGEYTLIALPLRIEGADASPVRAVLAPAS
jgi:arylformamidase